jgi:hypothetical protein
MLAPIDDSLRDTLTVNGQSTLGRKVFSTPTFSDYQKKKKDTKMKRVMSVPNITSSKPSFYSRFFSPTQKVTTIATETLLQQLKRQKMFFLCQLRKSILSVFCSVEMPWHDANLLSSVFFSIFFLNTKRHS